MKTSVESSNSSLHPQIGNGGCYLESKVILTAWLIIYILFLPIFIFVLYTGYQRWRNQHPVSTHTDVFTFHMVVMEMFTILGTCIYCWGLYAEIKRLMEVGTKLFKLASNGQMFFHVLTCVERYLAVVHPITYRDLKQVGGVRIRNISIGCVWLLCIGMMCLQFVILDRYFNIIKDFFTALLSLAIVSFCSFSVLCVLIRPVPGEVGGNGKLIDQSKRRAFYTIVVIMGALGLRLLVRVGTVMFTLADKYCVVLACALWFYLPSSLVLPLLFMDRARKLSGVDKNNKQ